MSFQLYALFFTFIVLFSSIVLISIPIVEEFANIEKNDTLVIDKFQDDSTVLDGLIWSREGDHWVSKVGNTIYQKWNSTNATDWAYPDGVLGKNKGVDAEYRNYSIKDGVK